MRDCTYRASAPSRNGFSGVAGCVDISSDKSHMIGWVGGGQRGQRGAGPLVASLAMRIARELYDAIIDHARAEAPNECVGLVAARDSEAVEVLRARNAEASPLRFSIDSQEQVRLWKQIDDAGLEIG